MICPHCQEHTKFPVKETRLMDGDVVRRRECDSCGKHFGTREKFDPALKMGTKRGYVRKTPVAKPHKSNELFKAWK